MGQNFAGQDLKGRDFSRQDLSKANFAGANLAGAVFSDANLTDATLDDADLTDASFVGTNLARARLQRAKLERSGIEFAHLPGADLTDATATNLQDKLMARLELAKDFAGTLRGVFLVAAGVFSYVVATALSTKDALILTNQTSMELPLLEAKVSVHSFFFFSAIVTFALSAFILAQVGHFARITARLPARLPGGQALREHVDPWVLSCVGIHRRPDLPLHGDSQLSLRLRQAFELFGTRIPGLLARWLAPLVLWLLIFRFAVAFRSDPAGTKVALALIVLSAVFLACWMMAFGLLSYSELVEGVTPLASEKRYFAIAFAAVVLAIGGRILIGLTLMHGAPNEDLEGVTLAGADLHAWNLSGSKLAKANLSGSNLERAHLQETDLSGNVDLRHAKLVNASFAGAELPNARLALSNAAGANFWYAKLTEADLREVTLDGAILQFAHFEKAKGYKLKARNVAAQGAFFAGATIEDAFFDGSALGGAHFDGAALFRTSFVNADLRGASFNGAGLFWAKFTGANLIDTKFTGATLGSVDFQGAYLRDVKLIIEDGYAINFAGATLRDVVIARGANLQEANFKGADIDHLTAVGVKFPWAHFEDASLKDVTFDESNLGGAHFERARKVQNVSMKRVNARGLLASQAAFGNSDLKDAEGVKWVSP